MAVEVYLEDDFQTHQNSDLVDFEEVKSRYVPSLPVSTANGSSFDAYQIISSAKNTDIVCVSEAVGRTLGMSFPKCYYNVKC